MPMCFLTNLINLSYIYLFLNLSLTFSVLKLQGVCFLFLVVKVIIHASSMKQT